MKFKVLESLQMLSYFEFGTWNLELETWNLKLGTLNSSPCALRSEPINFEP
jgi:hypothetical protein